MAGRFMQLMLVSISAILLAGCLSVNVDKTEHNSTNAMAPVQNGPHSIQAESAD